MAIPGSAAPPPPQPPPATATSVSELPRDGHTDSRVGFGFDVGGGGLIGITAQFQVARGSWLDLGLHGRVAITPGDAPDHMAPAFTASFLQEMSESSTRGAVFGVVGATPPSEGYRDAFIAGGVAMRVWSPKRRTVNTLAAGPGWLPVRVVPGAAPGPPFMIFLRYALHFHGADTRLK